MQLSGSFERMSGLKPPASGVEEKLRLLFAVYDTDRDRRLSDKDLARFVPGSALVVERPDFGTALSSNIIRGPRLTPFARVFVHWLS